MVRALSSHQHGPGMNPGAIMLMPLCGLNLKLVLSFATCVSCDKFCDAFRESSFNMTRRGGMKILRGGSENF